MSEQPPKTGVIYTLRHPVTGEICYVGRPLKALRRALGTTRQTLGSKQPGAVS